MPDWEKVIRGLRCCRDIHVGATLEDSCNQCPYQKEKGRTCVADELFHDALALLKAQEPHVMTIDDMRDLRYGDFAIIEQMPGIIIPAIVADNIELNNNLTVLQVVTPLSNGRLNADYEYYGKTWRCWTSRPSTEQRESVEWD